LRNSDLKGSYLSRLVCEFKISTSPVGRRRRGRHANAMLLALAAALVNIRPAVLSDPVDGEALCAVRAPTQYVVEDGGVGFMGKRVELTPEEAFKRRMEARLGTAMRDDATILIATDSEVQGTVVIGTVDCVELAAGNGRRALSQELPRRVLIRNLWVAEPRRRQGVARRLMMEAESLAIQQSITFLTLEVNADNDPAISLYRDLGFKELDPLPAIVPKWMRGALLMGKAASVQ
jgi:ribosomal protein S18 acetylase RimI-like enzyme